MPCTLCNKKKDEFLTLEQGNITVIAYKAKSNVFYRFTTQILDIEKEWIHHFVKHQTLIYRLYHFK